MTHSVIGASSMKRWQSCPGSVRLSENLEDRTTEYAAEGTVAHAIAEECLVDGIDANRWLNRVINEDGFEIKVTQDMIDAVQFYIDYVRALAEDPDSAMHIEHKFHMKELHEGLFGTNDACVYQPMFETIHVLDYKHGQGVAVEVVDNPQLLYYALGFLLEFKKYKVRKVVMHIVQPRYDHPDGFARCWEVDVEYLQKWKADLLDAVDATERENAPLVPGDYCRWCKAQALCPQLRQLATDSAQHEFSQHEPYDGGLLAELLDRLPLIESWCKAVREFAYQEALHGRVPAGHKLVDKRPTRRWQDDEKALTYLMLEGLTDTEIYERKMITPAQAEKKLGKASKQLIAKYTVTESSGLTLVGEDDKRGAVNRDPVSEFASA